MSHCRWFLIVALLLGVAALRAPAAGLTLGIGDVAPPLTVKEFVKGDPVTKFEKGKIYVIDFCETGVIPWVFNIRHLTELQKKCRDVTFIGVFLHDNPGKGGRVKPFVEKRGEEMGYRAAIDIKPKVLNPRASGEACKDNCGAMAKAWLWPTTDRPWDRTGRVPWYKTFIVDDNGKIAWIGNPLKVDEPLAKIRAGQWNLQAAAAEYAEKSKSGESDYGDDD